MSCYERLVPFERFVTGADLQKVATTWEAGGLLEEGWTNIPDHMCAVAAIGLAMYRNLTPEDPSSIAKACLIHDAFKRREVEAKKASKGDPRVLDEMAAKQKLFLLELGWPPVAVSATNAVGHTALRRFFFTLQLGKISILDKIVHLADSLTEESDFPQLEVRMAKLRIRYERLQAEDPKNYGLPAERTMFGVQEEIAFRLLAEFGDRMRLQPRRFHELCIEDANLILGRS